MTGCRIEKATSAALALCLAGLSFSTALYSIGLALGLLLFVVDLWRHRQTSRDRDLDWLGALGAAMIAYGIAFFISAIMGVRPAESLGEFSKLKFFLLAWLIANHVPDRRHLLLFLGALAAGVSFSASAAIYEHHHPGDWKHQHLAAGHVAGRASDTIDFSSRTGPILAMGLSLVMFTHLSPPRRTCLAAGCLLVFAALVYTRTRANWVALSAGLLVVAAVSRRRLPLLLMAGLLAAPLLVESPLTERYSTVASRSNPSNQYRLEVIKIGLGIAADYFPWGVGRSNFGLIHDQRKARDVESKLSSHNNYLDLLCECGILGLASFLALHVALLIRLLDALKRRDLHGQGSLERALLLGAGQAFVTFMAFGLFHSNWTYLMPPAVLMAIIGLAWGVSSQSYEVSVPRGEAAV